MRDLFLLLVAALVSGAAWAQVGAPAREAPPPAGAVQPIDARLGDASARPLVAMPSVQNTPVLAIGRDYRIAANDLMDIEVLDLDMKRTVRVNTGGFITLPYIGPVKVGGLTQHEAELLVADRFRERHLQNPQVSVFLREVTTERFTVEGAVVRPGIFPLTGQITLLRVLAMAGGFAAMANSTEVVIMRTTAPGKRQIAAFDVERIRAGKDDDPAIQGDDLIVVQRDNTRRLLKDSLFRDIIDSINPFSVLIPK